MERRILNMSICSQCALHTMRTCNASRLRTSQHRIAQKLNHVTLSTGRKKLLQEYSNWTPVAKWWTHNFSQHSVQWYPYFTTCYEIYYVGIIILVTYPITSASMRLLKCTLDAVNATKRWNQMVSLILPPIIRDSSQFSYFQTLTTKKCGTQKKNELNKHWSLIQWKCTCFYLSQNFDLLYLSLFPGNWSL